MDMTVYNFADRDPQKAAIAIRSRVEQEGQEGSGRKYLKDLRRDRRETSGNRGDPDILGASF